MAMLLLLSLSFPLDLSAFDPQPIAATSLDLSAFDSCAVSLDAFDVRPQLDLSAFDGKPAVKPSAEALDYPLRKSNWTHPGNTKSGLVDHLLQHPNHAGKFSAEMLLGMDYNELESLHSDDHEGVVQVAAIKTSPPAAVACPSGSCPVPVSPPRTESNSGRTPATATPQPVYYYTGNWCPTGNCPTQTRAGLFSGLRIRGR